MAIPFKPQIKQNFYVGYKPEHTDDNFYVMAKFIVETLQEHLPVRVVGIGNTDYNVTFFWQTAKGEYPKITWLPIEVFENILQGTFTFENDQCDFHWWYEDLYV